MSFSLSVYAENCQAIDIKILNNFANDYFRQLLNLSHSIDLKLNFRKAYQQAIFTTLNNNENLVFIESELLDVYVMAFFIQNDDWQIMGFTQPNYHFYLTELKENLNRVEIVLAISVLFAVAKLLGQVIIYGDNIFLNAMKTNAQNLDVYYIDDILKFTKEENLTPFENSLIIEFNKKAFNYNGNCTPKCLNS